MGSLYLVSTASFIWTAAATSIAGSLLRPRSPVAPGRCRRAFASLPIWTRSGLLNDVEQLVVIFIHTVFFALVHGPQIIRDVVKVDGLS